MPINEKDKGKVAGTNTERIYELEQWSLAQDRLNEKYRKRIIDLELRAEASAITLGELIKELNKREVGKILLRVRNFSTEVKQVLAESLAERRKKNSGGK